MYNSSSENSDTGSRVSKDGIFTYLPLQDRMGYFLIDGSTASSVNWQPAVHVKNDNSNFSYIGRSYGVGSSVGLTDTPITLTDGTVGYAYTELGYQGTVECIYNATSEFHLIPVQTGESSESGWRSPDLFLATGSGPDTYSGSCADETKPTDCFGFIIASNNGIDDALAVSWWASAESGNFDKGLPNAVNYLGKTRPVDSLSYSSINAGSNNLNLNSTQCGIKMLPALFNVSVDLVERTIKVDVRSNISQPDIEPSGFLADSASASLGVMSYVDTTTLTSTLGIMLQRNIKNVKLQLNLTTVSDETTNATLQAVAETLEALIDDYLVAIGSAQLMLAQDTQPVSPEVTSTALVVGERIYIIATCCLNIFLLLLYIEEAIRTRFWNKLPNFDYTSVEDVIVASSRGGHEIGEQVYAQIKSALGIYGADLQRVNVMLDHDDGSVLKMVMDEIELVPLVENIAK